jgi:hypothetical protein
MKQNNHIFISYARENKDVAERIYMDLRRNNFDVWIDSKSLLPGQNWKLEIQNKIKTAAFFILLISKHSINKRGFVQKEIKEAIEILEEFPTNETFIIPVRIDETNPIDNQLQNLNWVNLFPSYEQGFGLIFRAICKKVSREDLFYVDPENQHIKVKEGGSLIETSPNPYQEVYSSIKEGGISSRAPVAYSPFLSFEEFVKQIMERIPDSAIFFNPVTGFYLDIDTNYDGIMLPTFLKEKYPNEITLVIQHTYAFLDVLDKKFIIGLWFNQKKEVLEIPYLSIKKIRFEELKFTISNNLYDNL